MALIIILLLGFSTKEIETTVVSCDYVATENVYEVTVEDNKGNEWAYYDDSAKANGEEIICVFNKANEIVDAKGEN